MPSSGFVNLNFELPPLTPAPMARAGDLSLRLAIGCTQMIAAVRAYNRLHQLEDWLERLSNTYVVAVATLSADDLAMRHIQALILAKQPIDCKDCIESSLSTSLIRQRLFPKLSALRTHAEELLRYLDTPELPSSRLLNIKGVYDYCHSMFSDNLNLLYGVVPATRGQFPLHECQGCRTASDLALRTRQ